MIALLSMLISLPLSAYGQSQNQSSISGYIAIDNQNDCKIFTNNIVSKKIKWNGMCLNGYASGNGRAEHYLNEVLHQTFDGKFIKGKINGWGTANHTNGEKFVGEYKDGKMHGQGTYTFLKLDPRLSQICNKCATIIL
jgi:hypothetical protein